MTTSKKQAAAPRKQAAKQQAATPRGPRAEVRPLDEQARIDSSAPTTTPDAVPLHECIRRIMSEMPNVPKSRNMSGGGVSYSYRSIEDLLPDFTKLAAFHGLTIRPAEITAWNTNDVGTTSSGNPKEQTQLKIRWKLIGPTGEFDHVEIPSQAMDTSDKGVAKAVTQSRKLLIECLLFPPTEAADDPDHQSTQRGDDRAQYGGNGASTAVVPSRAWDAERLAFAQSQLDVVTDAAAQAAIVSKLAEAAGVEASKLEDFTGDIDEWVSNGVEHWVERWLDKQAQTNEAEETQQLVGEATVPPNEGDS